MTMTDGSHTLKDFVPLLSFSLIISIVFAPVPCEVVRATRRIGRRRTLLRATCWVEGLSLGIVCARARGLERERGTSAFQREEIRNNYKSRPIDVVTPGAAKRIQRII